MEKERAEGGEEEALKAYRSEVRESLKEVKDAVRENYCKMERHGELLSNLQATVAGLQKEVERFHIKIAKDEDQRASLFQKTLEYCVIGMLAAAVSYITWSLAGDADSIFHSHPLMEAPRK